MASKMHGLNYSCEICGVEGLNDEEMRTHITVYHLDGTITCPFCNLTEVSAEEMRLHVNSAHLHYLTPEQELLGLAFIDDDDDDDDSDRATSRAMHWARFSPEPKMNGWNNNNNNNNNYCDSEAGSSSGAQALPRTGAGSDSPLRTQLALNLRSSATPGPAKKSPQQCPLCSYSNESPLHLEEHINRQHFDLTSPSFPAISPAPREVLYNCPLCIRTFQNSPDLELHVNIEHKDILSPAKVSS